MERTNTLQEGQIDHREWFALLLLCSLTIAYYLPSISAWYRSDDFLHLPAFAGPLGDVVGRIFTGHVYGTNGPDQHYRPISMLLYAFTFRQNSVIPGHLISLTLHLLSGATVYLILRHFFTRTIYPLLGAALFLFHHGTSGAHLWLSAQADLLTTFLSLVLALVYIRSTGKSSYIKTIGIGLLFLVSLLSKEMSISLPFFLLLFSFANGRLRQDFRLLISLAISTTIWFFIRSSVVAITETEWSHEFLTVGIHSIKNTVRYFVLLFSPVTATDMLHHMWLIPSIFLLLPLFWTYFRKKETRETVRNAGFFLFALIVALGPVINLYNPWYTYYPVALLSIAFASFAAQARSRIATAALCAFIIVSLFGTGTIQRRIVQAGKFCQEVVAEGGTLKSSKCTIIGMPVVASPGIGLFNLSSQFSRAMAFFHDQQVEVSYASPCALSTVPTRLSFVEVADTAIALNFKDVGLDYLFPACQDDSLQVMVEFSGENRLGKPQNATVEVPPHVTAFLANIQ